jgi:hypothetical protein
MASSITQSSFFQTAPAVEYPLPIPLREEINKRPEFPIQSLSPLLKDAVEAIVDVLDCPIGLAALSVLGASSLAVQAHAMLTPWRSAYSRFAVSNPVSRGCRCSISRKPKIGNLQ